MNLKQTLTQKIKSKMRELDTSPKKFLGQHFLINSSVVEKIISAVEILNPALIMEVGPGLGTLTEHFIPLGRPLYVVELDSVFCRYWRRKKKICVLEGDILKLSWFSYLLPDSVLVGNLPYQIASRLMIQCCLKSDNLKAMALMFQKEVAQRIVARPCSKSYGLLSVLSQCFWEVNFLVEAAVSDFYPRPKVAGQVLIFRRKKCSVQSPAAFLAFVKFCFSQRRKKLLSRLTKIKKQMKPLNSSQFGEGDSIKKTAQRIFKGDRDSCFSELLLVFSPSRWIDIFNEINISPSTRPEELSPEQFVFLFTRLEAVFVLEKANRKSINFTTKGS